MPKGAKPGEGTPGKQAGQALVTVAPKAVAKPRVSAGRAFLTLQEQELTDAAVEVFTGVIGGRRALAEILSCADDPRIADALSLLMEEESSSPNGQGNSRPAPLPVREICRRCNLTVADLYRSFLDATALMAKVRAAPHVARKLAETTREVMDRAITRTVICKRCKGCGTITVAGKVTKACPDPPPEILPCDRCDGYGEVTVEGDLERQKIALEMGGMLKRGGGPTQNLQVNLAPAAPALRSYAQEQAALDAWLTTAPVPGPPALDADVLPSADSAPPGEPTPDA